MTPAYQPRYRNSWALVIGINRYQHVSPLSYACNDADLVAATLTSYLGFPSDQVIILKDQQATKQAILDAFHSFVNKADDPDDRIFVFYAGHGLTLQGIRGEVGCLVPVDGNPANTSTLIRWDDLTRNADLISAKHILFVMDACYSGLATQRALTPGTKRFLRDMLQRPARQVLTAGKADQTVADGGGPSGKNSIFTGYLIEALQGNAADSNGVLTANNLMLYVYQRVGQDPRSNQTPHYGHVDGDGDFVLLTPDQEHLAAELASDYLLSSVAGHPESKAAEPAATTKPSFAASIGYGDPNSPNFGRNDWSQKLAELRATPNNGGYGYNREWSKAYSWLSLIAEPTTPQSIAFNILQEARSLPNSEVLRTPFGLFMIPDQARTTYNSVVFYEEDYYQTETPHCYRYLRVQKNGNIEFASSKSTLFRQWQEYRLFSYVQIIGLTWQFMFFVKQQLGKVGYTGGVDLYVNIVGTRDTMLFDFAKGQGINGSGWAQPFTADWYGHRPVLCSDPNLQMPYKLVLGSLDKESSFNIVQDLAEQLGLAYNHQSELRCFNYGTQDFPWNQFFEGQR